MTRPDDRQWESSVGDLGEVLVVYILGSGHCGSTLLSLLLNGHPHVVAVGEISSLADMRIPEHPGSRKNRELTAAIWCRTAERWEAATGNPLREIDIRHPRSRAALRWRDDQVAEWADRNARLFLYLAEASGASLLVDSSKFASRLYLLHRSGRFRLKVIELRRDGRAVVYSYRRRGRTFRGGCGRWAHSVIGAQLLRRRFDADDWLTVRYEDLAQSPKETLGRVCAFLQIEFTPSMLRFRDHESIAIGGNAMRYGRSDEIVIDDDWKDSLARRDRFAFALVGGVVNRLLGY